MRVKAERRVAIETNLAVIFRGRPEEVAPPTDPDYQADWVSVALHHRMLPLVARALRAGDRLSEWPDGLRSALVQAAREATLVEPFRAEEIRRVVAALVAAGVRPLLIKGAALAYTHYPDPALRPRCDTDLLVDAAARSLVERVMRESGYAAVPGIAGRRVTYQAQYQQIDDRGVRHAWDVHWKITNTQLFADVLRYEELQSRARPVPALGDAARAPGDLDALLLACIHRVAHHNDDRDLLWLYDIHLIAGAMSLDGFDTLEQLAAQKRLRAVCARGLSLARDRFGTEVPAALLGRMTGADREASAQFVGGRMRRVDVLIADLRALPGWRARLELLREHLLPPASYMLERYALSSRALLPALYAHRILAGARGWFATITREAGEDGSRRDRS